MEQLIHKNNIAVVGAGPSGIYCALNILFQLKKYNFNNFKIDIFDFSLPLKTLLPTGGGRCNFSNNQRNINLFIKNYPRGGNFLKQIFSRYFIDDTLNFFKILGIDYIIEGQRIFPKSQSSLDVKNKMLEKLNSFSNVNFINKKVNSKNDIENYDYIVVSAGSRGSENLIKSFNHNLFPFKKTLLALNIKEKFDLEGVSVKACDGDFVFTKNGISGPLAFMLSSVNLYKQLPYQVSINLFDVEKIIDLIKAAPKKSIGNIISEVIPRALSKKIVSDFDKKASEVSKKQISDFSKLNLTVTSLSDNIEIVNAGGVDLAELDKNCKSKKYDNLWYIGEILNIDGFTGGFNLQNCWSTAAIAAFDIVRKVRKANNV